MMRAGQYLQRLFFYVAALMILSLLSNVGQAAQPLLQENTQSLYQRILTRPGCKLYKQPADNKALSRPSVFTAFYVFARKTVADKEWLQVGANATTEPSGWVSADKTVAWKQTMVMAFNNPAERLPVLFFDEQATLKNLLKQKDLPQRAKQYAEAARSGKSPAGSGIVSIEPEEHIDIKKQFYLIPILDAKRAFVGGGRSKILEVASIPIQEQKPAQAQPATDNFDVGIVFVIDTTISMDPYINRTRKAVQRIYDRIMSSKIAKQVSFGIVGFRDNARGNSGLEYVSRVYAPLRHPPQPQKFLQEIKKVKAARASTRGFNEDGLAGIMAAVNMKSWDKFAGKYIIFVSDAGIREPPDPLASTAKSAKDVNGLSADKGIAIISMLMATDKGKAYHDKAKRQLRELSQWEADKGNPPLFENVPRGAIEDFGPQIDALTDRIIQQTRQSATQQSNPAPAQKNSLLGNIDRVGYAMRLAWLGRRNRTLAPDVFSAWTTEASLNNPIKSRSLKVKVLLTRNQLSDLYAALKVVREAATQTIDKDPNLFFEQLQTVLARVANDPSQIQSLDPAASARLKVKKIDNLGALLGEYLGHLPYKSNLMSMTREQWSALSTQEQAQQLETINRNLAIYKHYYDDVDHWIALHPKATQGELVYPISIDFLP